MLNVSFRSTERQTPTSIHRLQHRGAGLRAWTRRHTRPAHPRPGARGPRPARPGRVPFAGVRLAGGAGRLLQGQFRCSAAPGVPRSSAMGPRMKRRSYAMLRAAAALAVLVVASPAWAELRGEVVRIIDGDTIDVLVDKQPVRVRLVDIDAPEKRQAFGERARQALAGMVFRRHVLVDEKDTDRYGRTLGTVWVNMELASRPPQPRNVNAAMVHQGMAWAYRFHGRAADPEMLRLEQEARGKRVGLWSDPHAVEPWKWRRESNNRRDEG